MDNKPRCRYCKDNAIMELEKEVYRDEIGILWAMHWYECPLCGSKAPISYTEEGALEYAVNGYD